MNLDADTITGISLLILVAATLIVTVSDLRDHVAAVKVSPPATVAWIKMIWVLAGILSMLFVYGVAADKLGWSEDKVEQKCTTWEYRNADGGLYNENTACTVVD